MQNIVVQLGTIRLQITCQDLIISAELKLQICLDYFKIYNRVFLILESCSK